MISKDQLPDSDFYAVIFSSEKTNTLEGYVEMDELTMNLVKEQSGYLGFESLSNANKTIFISYWDSLESIQAWRIHSTHQMAKAQAKKWYKRYLSQICLVKRNHYFEHTLI
ncbi:MAG: antibiotic biosynthesis monooxygenase [Bacteroidia bacterium]|jgi:heme-degrading monooxygenase HmoA|nr:antibiotic biosynthesis monooxygenase [Bacteroidia bacterium]